MRTLVVTLLWVIFFGLWFSRDVLFGDDDSINGLTVCVSFAYPWIPLFAGVVAGFRAASVFQLVWWQRANLSAAACCGVVLVFLLTTRQSDFTSLAMFFVAGASIGCSATLRDYERLCNVTRARL
jgi:hypothetical protein